MNPSEEICDIEEFHRETLEYVNNRSDVLYVEFQKVYGDLTNSTTRAKILHHCKKLSDQYLENYKKDHDFEQGINVMILTEVCKRICDVQ